MKTLYLALAVSLGISTSAVAANSGTFSISGLGPTGWAVQCTLTKTGGGTSEAVIRGKAGTREAIVRSGISSASCKVQAPPRGSVSLTLENSFTCPSAKDARGICKWSVESGQSGDFTAMKTE